jgi:Zn-dependent protease
MALRKADIAAVLLTFFIKLKSLHNQCLILQIKTDKINIGYTTYVDASLQSIVILFVVLLASMSIHEMMHAFASNWLGDDTARLQGRLTLNPLPHIDPFLTVALPLLLLLSGSPFLFGAAKPVQVNFNRLRYGEMGGAIVGMIGPFTNFVIACVAAILFRSLHPDIGTTLYDVFRLTIALNVGLFVFNSIPWPPLDGSRLLYAFAPRGLQEVMENIEHSGLMSLVIFIFLFYQFGAPIQHLMGKLIQLLAPGLVL